MFEKRDSLWKYAPVWAVLFAASASLLKRLGTQYILKREVDFKWADAGTALVGAVIGYVTFRMRFGEKKSDHWYTR